jgi:hypothetical protein
VRGVRRGVVVAFDEVVGLGRVASPGAAGASAIAGAAVTGAAVGRADADGRVDAVGEWEFHCTQIAGGSRSIDVGIPVLFSLGAGRLGRWEAWGVTPA